MKIIGSLLGIGFFALIGLLFYWLQWDKRSEAEMAKVQRQLSVLEKFWNERAGQTPGTLRIGYSEMTPNGFPFNLRVRLLKPYLLDQRGDTRFSLTMNYLDILPQSEDGSHYLLEYPADSHAIIKRGNQHKSYYLSISHVPQLMVKKRQVGGRMPTAVNQYGVIFPPQLIFSADHQGNTVRYPLSLMATDDWLDKPLFTNLRARLDYVRRLLEAKR